jgi:hypothetical protein
MTRATVGEIRRAREWVEALAAKHKGVRVAYLLCRMIRDAGEEWPAGPLRLGDGSDTDWDYDFAVVLDDLEGIPISADGQVELDTAPFDVMWFLLGRDISEDELALYTENMRPLWKRAGVECGNASCASRIEMDRKEYEQVRSDSATFAIVKGHEIADVEEIVERRKRYDVVRKIAGEAEEIAEKTDLRT